MSVDVYDVKLGKKLGSFKTEAETLNRARLLLDDFGPEDAADLEIGFDDGHPNRTRQTLLRRLQEDDEGKDRAQRSARSLVAG